MSPSSRKRRATTDLEFFTPAAVAQVFGVSLSRVRSACALYLENPSAMGALPCTTVRVGGKEGTTRIIVEGSDVRRWLQPFGADAEPSTSERLADTVEAERVAAEVAEAVVRLESTAKHKRTPILVALHQALGALTSLLSGTVGHQLSTLIAGTVTKSLRSNTGAEGESDMPRVRVGNLSRDAARELVLRLLKSEPGLDEMDVADRLSISFALACEVCDELVDQGLIERHEEEEPPQED